MSGPARLRESGSPLERELTTSSDVDAPIDGAKSRAFAALGITAVGASVAPAIASAVAKRTLFGIHLSSTVKIVGAVAVASGAAFGGYEIHAHRAAQIRMHEPTVAIAPEPVISAAPPIPPTPVVEPLPKIIPAPSASHDSAPRPHHDDSAELSWIDRAQSALKNDPARALEIVDEYRRTVSPRAFDEEASVVAIEACERTGDADRAQREADRFFATYPHSAYRSRIEALLKASP